MHHEENGFHAHHEPFDNLAREGRIQFVSLGAHTSRMYADHLTQWSTRDRTTGWSVHPVQTLVTVRPLSCPRPHSPGREGKKAKAYEESLLTDPLDPSRSSGSSLLQVEIADLQRHRPLTRGQEEEQAHRL